MFIVFDLGLLSICKPAVFSHLTACTINTVHTRTNSTVIRLKLLNANLTNL
jgi:hypothetical protein